MGSRTAVLIVGAGIFGLTAAIELKQRGYDVAVLEPGPLPHPLAASTDISKVVRLEYGSDELYVELAERAREGWLAWNESLFEEPLYHETGAVFLSRSPMGPGGYEYENYHMLLRRGYRPERLTQEEIGRRLPAWNADLYVDGYFNPVGGYVESGRVIESLVRQAEQIGLSLHAGKRVVQLIEEEGRIVGVRTDEEQSFRADEVIVAAGAWTPLLVPELAAAIRVVGQPVFHLKPGDPSLFEPPHFYVFGADVARTGWYGMPLHPRAQVVKIANHGPGRPLHPARDERVVTEEEVRRFRGFLAETFPLLARSPIVETRCCLYCDTFDGAFWIARHPSRAGLTVASGGSGHAFKFGPVLGGLVADAFEGHTNPTTEKFGWRAPDLDRGGEISRYLGEDPTPAP